MQAQSKQLTLRSITSRFELRKSLALHVGNLSKSNKWTWTEMYKKMVLQAWDHYRISLLCSPNLTPVYHYLSKKGPTKFAVSRNCKQKNEKATKLFSLITSTRERLLVLKRSLRKTFTLSTTRLTICTSGCWCQTTQGEYCTFELRT